MPWPRGTAAPTGRPGPRPTAKIFLIRWLSSWLSSSLAWSIRLRSSMSVQLPNQRTIWPCCHGSAWPGPGSSGRHRRGDAADTRSHRGSPVSSECRQSPQARAWSSAWNMPFQASPSVDPGSMPGGVYTSGHYSSRGCSSDRVDQTIWGRRSAMARNRASLRARAVTASASSASRALRSVMSTTTPGESGSASRHGRDRPAHAR